MNTTQVTSAGIAVAIAVVIALGFLFYGPNVFSMFGIQSASTASTTAETATTTDTTTATLPTQAQSMNEQNTNAQPIPNPLPTTLTGNDTVVGTGAEAKTGDTVTVNYVGMLADGTVFDASSKHPETAKGFTFPLGGGQVIKGWDQGVVGMKVGGSRRLIIPASLAYGNQAVGGVIPANSTLIFDIQLLNVASR